MSAQANLHGDSEAARGASYSKWFAWVLARLGAVYNHSFDSRKRKLFSELAGTVLEVGIGPGTNLKLYPPGVTVVGIEPSLHMHHYLAQEAAKWNIRFEPRIGVAESLDMPDCSVDAVVSTQALCSVSGPEASLKEILRVLRPGGKYFFLEHTAAPHGTAYREVQTLLTPLWKHIFDGCHADREICHLIEQAGFASVSYQRFRGPLWLPLIVPYIAGVAVKAEK